MILTDAITTILIDYSNKVDDSQSTRPLHCNITASLCSGVLSEELSSYSLLAPVRTALSEALSLSS